MRSTAGRRPRSSERADWMRRIAQALGERREEIAALIAQEVGMPIKLSHMNPGWAPDDDVRIDATGDGGLRLGGEGRQLADRARARRRRRRHHPMELPPASDRREGRSGAGRRLHRRRQAVEVAPLNAFMLADVIDELGLPAGVFNLVTGAGPVIGEAMAGASRRRHDLLHRVDALPGAACRRSPPRP